MNFSWRKCLFLFALASTALLISARDASACYRRWYRAGCGYQTYGYPGYYGYRSCYGYQPYYTYPTGYGYQPLYTYSAGRTYQPYYTYTAVPTYQSYYTYPTFYVSHTGSLWQWRR
jgi:hypothetical protein